MKRLILLSLLYSKYFIKEIVIIVQGTVLGICLLLAIIPFLYSQSITDTIMKSIKQEAVYFSPYNRLVMILSGYYDLSWDEIESLREKVNRNIENDDIVGYGKMSTVDGLIIDSNYKSKISLYNDDLITYTQLPLSKGNWFTKKNNHGGSVPIIIGSNLAKTYTLNDEIELQINNMDGRNDIKKCIIIGALSDSDFNFNFRAGGTIQAINSLAVRSNEVNLSSFDEITSNNIIISPMRYWDTIEEERISSAQLIFLKDNVRVSDFINRNKGEIQKYGFVSSIHDMYEQQIKKNIQNDRNENYIILSIVMMLMLIFGIGGYTLLQTIHNDKLFGIYFLSGMKKSEILILILLSNFLLLLIPLVISIIIVTILSQNYMITLQTAILYSSFVFIIIYIIGSILSFTIISRNNPIKLLRKGN